MPKPSVEAIFLHGPKGEAMSRVDETNARAGLGLEGDRYFQPTGNEPDREITLIEAEAIEALTRDEKIPFEVAESRRNVVTRGVALNHLVGREFTVGGGPPAGDSAVRAVRPPPEAHAAGRPEGAAPSRRAPGPDREGRPDPRGRPGGDRLR